MRVEPRPTVVYEGPSLWDIGWCHGCHQPIHFLAAEVIAVSDNAAMSYHARCAGIDKEETQP